MADATSMALIGHDVYSFRKCLIAPILAFFTSPIYRIMLSIAPLQMDAKYRVDFECTRALK